MYSYYMAQNRKAGRPESPQVAAALPLILALREQGYGYRKIAAKLNAANVPTAQDSRWRPGTVRVILIRHGVA